MFCHMELVELTVTTCPVRCCYRKMNGQCGYTELTDDDLEPKTIALIKNEKVYKVKSAIAEGTKSIKIGLAIDRYSDFIKASFRRNDKSGSKKKAKPAETVNELDIHVSIVLSTVFALAPNQQKKFWSPKRFAEWAQRTGSAFTLDDVKQSLATIKL